MQSEELQAEQRPYDPYEQNIYQPLQPTYYPFGAPYGSREGRDPLKQPMGTVADYFTDLTNLGIEQLYSRGQPAEADGMGIYQRYTVPDKTLRSQYAPDAPITFRMNSRETISHVINRVRTAGVQINVDRQGLIYTGDNVPIDSKAFRRVLNNSAWFRRPQTLAHYKAKAAIRYAQKWNRAIRSYKSFEGADNKTDKQFEKMVEAREKRANDPVAQATAKIRALRKKYPQAQTVKEALEMSRRNVTDFAARILQQINASTGKLAGLVQGAGNFNRANAKLLRKTGVYKKYSARQQGQQQQVPLQGVVNPDESDVTVL